MTSLAREKLAATRGRTALPAALSGLLVFGAGCTNGVVLVGDEDDRDGAGRTDVHRDAGEEEVADAEHDDDAPVAPETSTDEGPDAEPRRCEHGFLDREVSIDTQAGVDRLEGYTGLTKLRIHERDAGDITDLSALACLSRVDRELRISGNEALGSLVGLEALSFVGDLIIHSNAALGSLAGLEALTSVNGSLSISWNASLTDLTALERVTVVGGGVFVTDNGALRDLVGLGALASVGARDYGHAFVVFHNEALESLAGLEALTTVGGGLKIWANPSLTSIGALGSLTSVGDALLITDNAILPTCVATELRDRLPSLGASCISRNLDDGCPDDGGGC